MRPLIISIVLGLTLATAPARAEFFIKEYEKVKDSTAFKMYIEGVGIGYSWANNAIEPKQYQLFCPPPTLELQEKNYVNILKRELAENKVWISSATNYPVELILLKGLQRTFPCKKTRP